MTRVLAVLVAALLVPWAAMAAPAKSAPAPPSVIRLTVPAGRYAVLRFGQPVVKAVLPPGAPLDGKPYFLSGNHVLLLMLKKGKHPVQAVIQLADGTTRVLRLHAVAGGGSHPSAIDVPDTGPQTQPSSLPPVPPSRNPAAGVVPVFSALLTGKPVEGWAKVDPDMPVLRYDRLTAVPRAEWRGDDGRRVVRYRLTAVGDAESTLDPSQFYRRGVQAALLHGSHVGPGHPAVLWLMLAPGVADGR